MVSYIKRAFAAGQSAAHELLKTSPTDVSRWSSGPIAASPKGLPWGAKGSPAPLKNILPGMGGIKNLRKKLSTFNPVVVNKAQNAERMPATVRRMGEVNARTPKPLSLADVNAEGSLLR